MPFEEGALNVTAGPAAATAGFAHFLPEHVRSFADVNVFKERSGGGSGSSLRSPVRPCGPALTHLTGPSIA